MFIDSKKINNIFLNLSIVTLLLSFFFYFTFVAIYGNHGLKKKIDLEFKILELSKKLSLLELKSSRIEHQTKKLRNDNLDIDLLDQQARIVLGLIRPDEIILLD